MEPTRPENEGVDAKPTATYSAFGLQKMQVVLQPEQEKVDDSKLAKHSADLSRLHTTK